MLAIRQTGGHLSVCVCDIEGAPVRATVRLCSGRYLSICLLTCAWARSEAGSVGGLEAEEPTRSDADSHHRVSVPTCAD